MAIGSLFVRTSWVLFMRTGWQLAAATPRILPVFGTHKNSTPHLAAGAPSRAASAVSWPQMFLASASSMDSALGAGALSCAPPCAFFSLDSSAAVSASIACRQCAPGGRARQKRGRGILVAANVERANGRLLRISGCLNAATLVCWQSQARLGRLRPANVRRRSADCREAATFPRSSNHMNPSNKHSGRPASQSRLAQPPQFNTP